MHFGLMFLKYCAYNSIKSKFIDLKKNRKIKRDLPDSNNAKIAESEPIRSRRRGELIKGVKTANIIRGKLAKLTRQRTTEAEKEET